MVITTDRSQFHAMIRNNLDFIGHLHRLRFLLWRILLPFTRGRSNSGRCGEGAAITWETPRRAAPGKWCAETWFWWSWVRTSGSRWFGSTAAECWPSASTAGRTSLRTGRDTDGQTNKRINATYIGGFKWGQEDHGPPPPNLVPNKFEERLSGVCRMQENISTAPRLCWGAYSTPPDPQDGGDGAACFSPITQPHSEPSFPSFGLTSRIPLTVYRYFWAYPFFTF